MTVNHTFTQAEIDAFAALSGDWNPLHTDPVAARRTPFGSCVAHGVLVLMRALELDETRAPGLNPVRVNARFLRPVPSGADVSIQYRTVSETVTSVTIGHHNRVMMQFEWERARSEASSRGNIPVMNCEPPHEKPADPDVEAIMNKADTLALHWPEESASGLFPRMASSGCNAALAAIVATTRVVGMKVPGEHSVFLQLDLDLKPAHQAEAPFIYRLVEHRRSSRRLGIEISGSACRGMLRALVRPRPVKQPGMDEVCRRVASGRFENEHVAVIGGSRGLGEVAAKILAAGGAKVIISYKSGAQDAGAVVEDIKKNGGKAASFELDVENADAIKKLPAGFDRVAFFASPPIAEGDGVTFNEELHSGFQKYYVTALGDIAHELARNTGGRFGLLNASSTYVESPPLRLAEYAAAKAGSETLCKSLQSEYPQAKIHIARFPRLLTDQTASFVQAAEADVISVIGSELDHWLKS